MIRSKLICGRLLVLFCLTMIFAFAAVSAAGDLSDKNAIKIGKENLKRLLDQSYHYRIDYDTVIAVPVHSKVIWKDDYYLLYFLKNNVFQVEMEVNRKTGEPSILSLYKMMQPYHYVSDGTFHYKYFNADSMQANAKARQRLEIDSVRLVYFGVIPRLGKRGVIWETFSGEGQRYFGLNGRELMISALVGDLNSTQQEKGNYALDSIRVEEILSEITRIESLTGEEKNDLGLKPEVYDSLLQSYNSTLEAIYQRFPNLRPREALQQPRGK